MPRRSAGPTARGKCGHRQARGEDELVLPAISHQSPKHTSSRAPPDLKRAMSISATTSVRASCWLISMPGPGSTGNASAGCALAGGRSARPGAGHTLAAHRHARSGRRHLAEIQGADRYGGGISSGRRYSIDRVQNSGGECGRGEKTVRAAEEFVRASKAKLGWLVTLQGYEKITAPFAGIVTARNVDVGALISATGSSQGPPVTRRPVRCSQQRRDFSPRGNRQAAGSLRSRK